MPGRQPAVVSATLITKPSAAMLTYAIHVHMCFAAALQVHGYAMYKDGSYAQVKYPTEGYSDDVAGRSFHHGCFVQQLRHKAAAQQSVTCRQAFVKNLVNGGCLDCTAIEMSF